MKKVFLALVAMITVTAAQAQGDNRPQRGDRQVDRTEMIKQRTDNTVQKYGLNEDQAAKLLALNTKYADKIGFGGMRGGARGDRPRPNFGGGGGQGAQHHGEGKAQAQHQVADQENQHRGAAGFQHRNGNHFSVSLVNGNCILRNQQQCVTLRCWDVISVCKS